jgi:outer membrane receptor protein involved in Fe transport
MTPLYMLRQAPGVRVNEFNLQGVASAIQFRGFSGGHGGEIGFYFDGIPLNDNGHADNYSDTSILIPYEIESIEIIKGPASALYGRGNAAGTAAFQGIKRGTFNKLMVRAGLDSTYELQGVVARDSGKLHQVYAFQGYTTNTWRDNTFWRRLNFSARWTYDASDRLELSFNVRAAIAKWANSLEAMSWQSPKKGSDDGSGRGDMTGGHRDRYDARFFANYYINDNSQISYYFFATSLENNMLEMYLKSPVAPWNTYAPGEVVDGNDQTGKREAYGTGLVYNYKGDVAGRDFSFTLGTDYLWEKQNRDMFELHWGSGDRHFLHYHESEYILNTLSFYGETNYQIVDQLKLRLGGRYDRLWGDVDYGRHHNDGVVGPAHMKSKTQGIFSPKVGLLFTPVEELQIYANYGKGFNIPGLNNGQFFSEHQLEMTEREQWELGFRLAPYKWMEFGSVFYLANTKNDIARNIETNQLENSGKTRRQGVENYVKFFPMEHFTISGDYTYQDVRTKKNIASPHLEGRRATNVPRHIINAEVAYAPLEGWGGRASFNYNIDIMLRDNPTSALHPFYHGEDYGTLDLQLSYRFNEKFKLSLDVTNVFNDRPRQGVPNQYGYFSYWPMNPTSAFLTLEMEL